MTRQVIIIGAKRRRASYTWEKLTEILRQEPEVDVLFREHPTQLERSEAFLTLRLEEPTRRRARSPRTLRRSRSTPPGHEADAEES